MNDMSAYLSHKICFCIYTEYYSSVRAIPIKTIRGWERSEQVTKQFGRIMNSTPDFIQILPCTDVFLTRIAQNVYFDVWLAIYTSLYLRVRKWILHSDCHSLYVACDCITSILDQHYTGAVHIENKKCYGMEGLILLQNLPMWSIVLFYLGGKLKKT